MDILKAKKSKILLFKFFITKKFRKRKKIVMKFLFYKIHMSNYKYKIKKCKNIDNWKEIC